MPLELDVLRERALRGCHVAVVTKLGIETVEVAFAKRSQEACG